MGISGDLLQIGVDVSANPEAAAQVDKVTAALGRFRAESAGLEGGSTDLGAQINVAVGAFIRLGQTIDVTNARAVAGFQAVGDALAGQLGKLGATDAELKRIFATVTQVQQAAGATNLDNIIPVDVEPKVTRASLAMRRGANAISSLSFAAAAGTENIQSLAFGAGAITSSFLALGGSSLVVATGIGAIVTIGFTLVSVLENITKKSKGAQQGLEDLNKEMRKSASTEAIRAALDETTKAVREAQTARDALAAQPRQFLGPVGPGAAPQVTGTQASINALDTQIANLQKQQAALLLDLERRGKDVTKELADAQRQSDQETARLAVRQTQGEFAEKRVVAEQEFENEKIRLTRLAVFEGQQNAAVDAAKRRRDQNLAAIDVEEAQKLAEINAAAVQKEIKAREAKELASNKATLDNAEAGLETSLSTRAITESQFIAARLAAQKAAIAADEQAQLEALGKILFAQRQAAKGAVGPEETAKRQADVKATEEELDKIRADARARNATAERDAAAKTATLNEELAHTVEQANVAVLESQGEFARAAQIQVQEEFRTAIDTALAQIASGNEKGLDALVAIFHRADQIVAAAKTKQAQTATANVFADLQSNLRQIQVLADTGAISQVEAQRRVLAAYRATRDRIGEILPTLRALSAAQPDNKALARDVQDLNTQYLELGKTIDDLANPLTKLKEAAKAAGESAAETFIGDATKLISQSHVEVNALRGELQSAQSELSQLLAIPANERTSNQTARITELRAQVESLTVSLGNSKQALTSWKSLFLDAAQSIVDALIKVSAQMLATQLIQGSLFSGLGGLLGFGGGGGALPPPPETAASGGFGFGFAGGGLVAGPGSSTSDSIPAMLSNHEYVLNAATVRSIGVARLDDVNFRRQPRHFADGGLVTRGPSADAASGGRLHVLIEHSSDAVVRVLESPAGQQATVKVVQKNRRAIASAL